MRTYRSKWRVLFLTALMTVPVHCLSAFSLFWLATGLGFHRVSWRDYFAICLMSGLASTIPLPAGPAETGIVFFYATAFLRATRGVEAEFARQQGLVLALVYRLSTILIAAIGAAYYFLGGRSEVTEVFHAAKVDGDNVVRNDSPA